MDVHRARFVPYPTSSISALAFSRTSDAGYTGPLPALKLALGRSNGNIEIWNPQKGAWVQEAVFLGDGKSIDGLAWTQDPDEVDGDGNITPGQQRLFSIASSPNVAEWDLGTGMVKRRSTGNFSEVWCFASQPRWKAQKKDEEARSQDIVAGCGDGALVLLSTADDDLQFKRNLARVSGKKARCMCITYQKPEIVVAGFADSMIRIYDTRNGSQLRQMSLGSGLPGAPKTALVWQVKILPNGDIVSGDSNGEVRIWDGKHYALSRRLTGHDSDCLDLITSSDGKTIFSGSLDGKMAVYRQSANDGGRNSWAKSSHRRMHNGEVKAMAAFDSSRMSVVISGGSDVTPVATPLREYGKENVRFLPTLPQEPQVTSAPKARLLVCWWEKSVLIWRIARLPGADSSLDAERPRKLVAKLTLDMKDSVRSASVSGDGKLLAVSTSTALKVFQLKRRLDTENLAVRKVDLPKGLTTLGARTLSFSPDGKWLASVTPDSEVHVARFAAEPDQPKRLRCLSQTVELERRHRQAQSSAYEQYDRAISRMAWAPDSSVLVVGDLSGFLDSWVLEGHEDSTAPAIDRAKHDSDKGSDDDMSDSSSDSSDDDDEDVIYFGQHWADNPAGNLLPKLESAPLVMNFRPQKSAAKTVNGNPGVHSTRSNPHAHSHELPTGQHMLWVLTSRHQMHELDVLAGRLSEWSKRNPTAALPEDFTRIKDRAIGAVWDEPRERVWVHGNSWVFMLDTTKDLADAESAQLLKRRRRRRSEPDDDMIRKKHKGTSGAGDKVDVSRRDGAIDSVKRQDNGRWTEVDMTPKRKSAIEDDDDDEEGLQLTRLRSSGDEDGEAAQLEGEMEAKKNWWLTFKYRPILGMVRLEDERSGDQNAPLEVAIVERPIRDR
ncbi:WD40 repeat-like protein [Hortaea werneckii]|nr:WD40 repeat-like protein [Hortaea werneckii]